MIPIFLWILLAVIIVSLISFIGALVLFYQTKTRTQQHIFFFVAFAAGALLGAAFLDLLPEAVEYGGNDVFLFALFGIIIFFILEKFVFWHHHHATEKEEHAFTYLNLIGDGLHNFIDGVIIAASFLVNIPLGIVTTIAIIFHEIPQELGDFSILVYGGFSRVKALTLNFLTALTAVLGAVLTYFYSTTLENSLPFLLSFAAGSFIYIASTDLIPELQKETNIKKSLNQFLAFLVGILVIYIVGLYFQH